MRLFFALSCVFLCSFSLLAAETSVKPTVSYHLSFANAAHHEAVIQARFDDVRSANLLLNMSSASPGRYALHAFAKNIYDLKATDSAGNVLPLRRVSPSQWSVGQHDGTVIVTYRLYGDRADGTYNQIDRSHAHLNMPATLLFAHDYEFLPSSLRFDLPDPHWKIATQLQLQSDGSYIAPDLQYLMDSPVELSAFSSRSWKVSDHQSEATIHLVMHHEGTEQQLDVFTEKAKAVVAEQQKIFGEYPKFDYGQYVFIADYLPYVSGDGMEHRNSTILTDERSLSEANYEQIETLSHEFFHAWNVERLRPADLVPFDFKRANMSRNLWFAEGVTNYYGKLILSRTGHFDLATYLEKTVAALNRVQLSPGRLFFAATGMSEQAPFVDAAVSVDPTNYANSYISYYTYGEVLGLALDLTLRTEFAGLSLDLLMRKLWQDFGKTGRFYTEQDLQQALAVLTANPEFAKNFFSRYVDGQQLPDFNTLFAAMGLKLAPAQPKQAFLTAVSLFEQDKQLKVGSNTLLGTPLYQAGVDKGDLLLKLGRYKLSSKAQWDKAMSYYKVGDTAELSFSSRGKNYRTQVTFTADPSWALTENEDATTEQLAKRALWLKAQD
ncbi:M61 family peptidase [Rheinheimera sediminis]|uniref:M61 family metallopeptidase n=1 Tax=Rheinheimera sp. YQF-1 TaxID=2499626 RepID=UPI000FDB00AD|nr:M61 family metallopeptidase [Rheinheimera sp. YQF-1]RVT41652.1 M61 family peptidase [Rheinheimera sp. YQF-1]